jgi:uncharacterized protein (DUF608 family)
VLFPKDNQGQQWTEFAATGFHSPVSGIVFHEEGSQPGVPLGGIGTGCIDIKRNGHLGRSSIFNSFAPPSDLHLPFAGVTIGGTTFCLQTDVSESDKGCRGIHYWGHYPIADVEYELDSPIKVGLRAWSPFLPGDAQSSNTPIIFFEFEVRNTSSTPQDVTVMLTFPGPSHEECGSNSFTREEMSIGGYSGLRVGWKGGEYVLAGTGDAVSRRGHVEPGEWLQVPQRSTDSTGAGCTVSTNVTVDSQSHADARFLLAWYMPRWNGSEAHAYWHAYARRFKDCLEIIQVGSANRELWLRRILAWQQRIYEEEGLPSWLKDQLVNVLHTIPRDAFWACDSIPRQSWYTNDGLFGLTESPRTTPHVCNPSDWYGGLPVVFFFPELMSSLLRSYVHFQLPTGEVPLGIGENADFCCRPVYQVLHPMNSCVHIQLIDRLWQRDRDERVLQEFYPSARSALQYMQSLDQDGDGLPELDSDPIPNQFYGAWPWYGVSIYVAGLWIASVKIMQRMAEAYGDKATLVLCQEWAERASGIVERLLWDDKAYLLYCERNTGRVSDTVLANQLAGQWCARLHGLDSIYPSDHINSSLQTILDLCGRKTSAGLLNSSNRRGEPDLTGVPHSNGIFTGECIAVGATMAYEGRSQDGSEVVRRMMESIVVREKAGWDLPNILDADGKVIHGTDFYQMMILWSIPLALKGQGIYEACAKGGLIDGILESAKPDREFNR